MAYSNASLLIHSNVSAMNETVLEDRFSILKWLAASSYVLMALGIPGNLLVITGISLTKHLRTAPNILVLNLSVCDTLFLCLIVPCHAYTYVYGRWDAVEICQFVAFTGNLLIGASILSTGAIALNRYVAIVLSNRYAFISRRKIVLFTVIAVYVIPCLLLMPNFTGSMGAFGFDEKRGRCRIIGKRPTYYVFVFVVIVLPFVLMTFCYIHISVVVLSSRTKVRPQGTARSSSKLSRMLALICLVYLITNLPGLVMTIVKQRGIRPAWYVNNIVFFLIWVSSAVNPIVYGLANEMYRNAYKTILRKFKCGKAMCSGCKEPTRPVAAIQLGSH